MVCIELQTLRIMKCGACITQFAEFNKPLKVDEGVDGKLIWIGTVTLAER